MGNEEFGVAPEYQISDELWKRIERLLPPPKPKKKPGRPRMDNRKAMEAILYVFRNGYKWEEIPSSLGAGSTVRRRFHEWRKAGLFQRMWRTGLLTYDEMREFIWYGKLRRYK